MKKKIKFQKCLYCDKVLSYHNKSKLCSYHFRKRWLWAKERKGKSTMALKVSKVAKSHGL